MKNIFLIFGMAITMISCEITERMKVSEDGQIQYETEVNLQSMVGIMFPESTKDSLKEIGEFPIDTLLRFNEADKYLSKNSQDSTISQDELDFYQNMDKSFVQLKFNDSDGYMKFITSEMNWKDFNAYWEKMDKSILEIQKKNPELAAKIKQNPQMTSMQLKLTKNSFEKKSNYSAQALMEGEYENMESEEFARMITYKMEYHFPKPIKSTTLKNASFSLDRKIMYAEIPLQEMFKNSDISNFKVVYE